MSYPVLKEDRCFTKFSLHSITSVGNEKILPSDSVMMLDFEKAIQQLNKILQNASEEHRGQRKETTIDENNLFWETDIQKLRVALHKWLKAERTYDVPVLPRYFEVGFGPEGEPRNPRTQARPRT